MLDSAAEEEESRVVMCMDGLLDRHGLIGTHCQWLWFFWSFNLHFNNKARGNEKGVRRYLYIITCLILDERTRDQNRA